MAVRRFDSSPLLPSKARRLDNGWLRAPARLTRIGVFDYARADGSVRRELRLPAEVFAADSLASFELVPITDDHPPEPTGLNAANAGKYQAGSVGERITADGEFVSASLLVTDGAVVEKILQGKVELSCGYFCDVEEASGIWTDTNGRQHKYDGIQRNIRGNHVAVVARGRAGPEARVRLDTADGVMVTSDSEHSGDGRGGSTMKIVLDGVEFEVSDQVNQALTNKARKDAETVEALKADAKAKAGEIEKLTARADAAEAKLKQIETAHADATDPAKFTAAVAARVALESRARAVLGAEHKLDGLDDNAVKLAVLAKLDTAFDAKGRSPEYVAARFDAALEFAAKAPAAPAAPAPVTTRVDNAAPVTVSEAKARFDAAIKERFEKRGQA